MSLVGLWAFRSSDGNGVDSSGNGNTALIYHGAAQNADGAVVLDGVDDYVEIPDAAQYGTTNGTLRVTFAVASGSMDGSRSNDVNDTSLQTLVSRDSNGNDGGGHVNIMVDGDGSLFIRHQSDTNDYFIRTVPGLVTAGEELDLVYSFSDTDGMTAYLDGVEIASNTDAVTNADSFALSQNNEPWTLGASQMSSGDGIANNLNQFFEGSIGHFEIYDEALPPDDLNTLYDLSDGVDDGIVTGTSGNDTIHGGDMVDRSDGGSVVNDTINAGAGDDLVYGGDGDDSITAGDGNDHISGGVGADTIFGGAGADSLYGGYGADWVRGGTGHDVLVGGAGADTLTSGSGNDQIDGGTGNDALYDDEGDDTVVGGTGNDTILVGAGTDSIDAGEGADTIEFVDAFGVGDTIAGGESTGDFDVIDLGTQSTGITVTFTGAEAGTFTDGTNSASFTQIESFQLSAHSDSVDGSANTSYMEVDGGAGNDTITTGAGGDHIYGGDGTDIIRAGSGNDYVSGGAGADNIDGDAGDDTLLGGDGSDLIQDNQGHNVLDGGTGNDTMITGAGNDLLEGGAGNDLLYGVEGNDSVLGGDGDDTIYVGAGTDSIVGGSGADSIGILDVFGTGNTIIGGESGADNDLIDLQFQTTGITVTFTSDEAGTFTDGANTAGFSQVEFFSLTGHNDSVDASVNTSEMAVAGGAGNDTILGGSGADTIAGGDGSDYIDGGAGDDYLTTGLGNDTLIGGDGNDTLMNSSGDDSLVGGAGNDSIIATGGNDTLEGGAGNDTLDGGADNDRIDGGTGDDNLTGGAGSDTFVYTPGDGSDTITDFNAGNSGTIDDGDNTNNDFIDLSGYYDHISELYADQADDGVLNQSNTTDSRGNAVDYSNNTAFASGEGITFQGASADKSSFTQENTGVVCFTSGTAILTPRGDVVIDDLRVGDLVCTLDNGPQRIRWIGRRSLDQQTLRDKPKMRPVLFKQGVLGCKREMLVSPQHGMLIGRRGDHLVRARHLAETMRGVRIANGKRHVTYIHLMFDAHQIILAEDIPSESFYPGPMALQMIDDVRRVELFELFPDLSQVGNDKQAAQRAFGRTTRDFISRKKVSALVENMPCYF